MSIRKRILDTASKLIHGDRNNQYGPPTQDFDRTARLWTAYFGEKLKPGARFQAHDVASFMALLKLSRLAWQSDKEDSWVDLAGYAACGAECALPEEAFQEEVLFVDGGQEAVTASELQERLLKEAEIRKLKDRSAAYDRALQKDEVGL